MNLREGQPRDIPQLVTLDRKSYGAYGEDERYFENKFTSPNANIIVAENSGTITGFVIYEVIELGSIPADFTDFRPDVPIQTRWAHIIAFTTVSNFTDRPEDSRLLQKAETDATQQGYTMFGVPLSINHPHPEAFAFFESNGYRKNGTIRWNVSPTETIDCFFYTKSTKNMF